MTTAEMGSGASTGRAPRFTRMILFGDSDIDGGEGAHGVYARSGGTRPGPPHFRGRYTNGPIWPEYLAPQLGVVYNPADNYAVGGATTGADNVIPDPCYADTGILMQVQHFLGHTPQVERGALVILSGGGNNLYPPGCETPAAVEVAIAELAVALDLLIRAGAQRVLVASLANLGDLPETRLTARAPLLRLVSTLFNHRLRQITASRPDQTVLVDVGRLMERTLAQPAAHGFTNVTDACLGPEGLTGDPAHYLFWDVHFTTAFHARIAARAYAALATAASGGDLPHQPAGKG